jgi:hypothetical protein
VSTFVRAPRPHAVDDGARTLALAIEATAVVIVAMALLARLHPPTSGPAPLPWERPLSSLPPPAGSTARAAFAALSDVERGVALGAPVDVAQLKDELVPPFSDPAFTFVRVVDGDVVGYVGRGDATAPFAALLLLVQPTTTPPSGAQDEEHHRVVDAAGAPRWLHGSVWFVPAGERPPPDGVAAPVALGYLRLRPR